MNFDLRDDRASAGGYVGDSGKVMEQNISPESFCRKVRVNQYPNVELTVFRVNVPNGDCSRCVDQDDTWCNLVYTLEGIPLRASDMMVRDGSERLKMWMSSAPG